MTAHTTVEMDQTDFKDLQTQIFNNKSENVDRKDDIRDKIETKEAPQLKKYAFRKGDSVFELDDDYEIEFMADKKPTKLTLRELKDRAAGDIAIKNRMHSLAEEKKELTRLLKHLLIWLRKIL